MSEPADSMSPRTLQLYFLTAENTSIKTELASIKERLNRIEGCVVTDEDDDPDFAPGAGAKRGRKKLTVAEVAAREEEKMLKSEHRKVQKSITYSARVKFEDLKKTPGYDKEKNTTLFSKEDRTKFNAFAMKIWDDYRKLDGDDLEPDMMRWNCSRMYPDVGASFDPAMALHFFDYVFNKFEVENGSGCAQASLEACSQEMVDVE